MRRGLPSFGRDADDGRKDAMRRLLPVACLAAGALAGGALIAPALAQKQGHDMSAMSSPSQAMHIAMVKMSKNMGSMKMTGDTDRDFAMMMAEHHQGAIAMAEIEVKRGKNSVLRAMAKKMIAAQKQERDILLKHAKMKH